MHCNRFLECRARCLCVGGWGQEKYNFGGSDEEMVLQCRVFLVSSPYPPNLHLPSGSTCNFSDENLMFVL